MKFLRLIPVLIIYSISFIGNQAWAQAEHFAVKLHRLESLHAQEKSGDELFISVTEFPMQENPIHYQVPNFPSHWISKYLPNIKDVVVWKKTLKQCEPVDLLISLVEEDLPPWNVNDLLGSVELKIKCVNGKPQEEWLIPDPKNTSKITSESNAFSFTGKNAEYHAVFKLEDTISNKQVADDSNTPKERKEKSAVELDLIPLF